MELRFQHQLQPQPGAGTLGGEENYLSKISFTGDFNSTYLYLAKVGQPVAQFYGIEWAGVCGYEDFDQDAAGNYTLKKGRRHQRQRPQLDQPGDIKYVDQNGDGVVNDQDMVVIGRCEPIHMGGFNNNFTYKNLSLNVFFQWRYGSDVMNANRIIFEGNYANKSINQYKSYVDRWSPTNTDSKNFRVGGRGPAGVYSSRTIEDGSFLRLKTLQLSYTPAQEVHPEDPSEPGAGLHRRAESLDLDLLFGPRPRGLDPQFGPDTQFRLLGLCPQPDLHGRHQGHFLT